MLIYSIRQFHYWLSIEKNNLRFEEVFFHDYCYSCVGLCASVTLVLKRVSVLAGFGWIRT